jgi:RNA polymerase-binding transcription factor DksA
MAGEKKTKTAKVTGKTAPKTKGKTTSKAPGKASGKTTGKTTNKTPAKPPRAIGKEAIKTPSKTSSKAPGKTVSKTLVRPLRPVNRTPSRAPAPPPRAVYKAVTMSKEEWDAFIVKMEQLLQDEKSEIINILVANNNEFKEIVDGMDPKDLADIASDDIDRRMIEMLGSQELKRLKLIESAQTRIKQGKYGHCIKCDRPIPPERLEAIPYALMCIDCKSEEERRNR